MTTKGQKNNQKVKRNCRWPKENKKITGNIQRNKDIKESAF